MGLQGLGSDWLPHWGVVCSFLVTEDTGTGKSQITVTSGLVVYTDTYLMQNAKLSPTSTAVPLKLSPPAHILLSSTQYLISKLPGLSLLLNVGYCEPCLGKAAKSLSDFRLVKHGGLGPGPGTTKPTIANGLQGTLNPQYPLSFYFGWFYFDLS